MSKNIAEADLVAEAASFYARRAGVSVPESLRFAGFSKERSHSDRALQMKVRRHPVVAASKRGKSRACARSSAGRRTSGEASVGSTEEREGRGPTRRGRGEESGGGRARTTDTTINCTKCLTTGGGHLTGTDFFVAKQIKVWRKEIEELEKKKKRGLEKL